MFPSQGAGKVFSIELDESWSAAPQPRPSSSGQAVALLKKSLAYQAKQKRSNCAQILFPVAVLALLTFIQLLVDNANSEAPIPGIDHPNGTALSPFGFEANPAGGFRPWRVGYTVQDGAESAVSSVLGNLDFAGTVSIGEYSGKDALEGQLFDDWNADLETPSRQRFSTWFLFENVDLAAAAPTIKYAVGYNDTGPGSGAAALAPASWMGQAIARSLPSSPTVSNVPQIREWPRKETEVHIDILPLLQPFFFSFILHFQLPIIIGVIVYDKEHQLLAMMQMVGVQQSMFWLVTWIYSTLMYMAGLVIFIGYGSLVSFVEFSFFRVNSPVVFWVFFTVFGQALIALAFVAATLFSRTQPASIFGYVAIFGLVIGADTVESNFEEQTRPSESAMALWAWLPSAALRRGISRMSDAAQAGGEGWHWDSDSRLESWWDDSDVVKALTAKMAVSAVVLYLIAAYLSQVVPYPGSVAKPLLWFLPRSLWAKSQKAAAGGDGGEVGPGDADEDERWAVMGPDVVRIRDETVGGSSDMVLRVLNLEKTYPGIGLAPPKRAVKGVTFNVRRRECFGLLGGNGAGKTTTISMLSGLFPPSSGSATIGGYNVDTDMDAIHQLIGVCPQQNILWEDLSPLVHMEFYARVKGLSGSKLTSAAVDGLKAVDLHKVRNDPVRTFSGGMKRRLSVAIAFLGAPQLVFLDEPTTGLDPALRQAVWKIINKAKGGCAIILTTHSMEEAEALCDRICIMARGRVRAVGEGPELKAAHGSGYTLAVTAADVSVRAQIQEFVGEILPSATLTSTNAGVFRYNVPAEDFVLADVFRALESRKAGLGIQDWVITQTTLEEVFLKIAQV